MKKALFLLAALALLCPAAPAAAALPSPGDLVNPGQKIDPDFEAIGEAASGEDDTSTELIIDPIMAYPFQPIKTPEIIIPPELLLGPKITDIEFAANAQGLRVTWETDDEATTKIEYGATKNYTKVEEDKELVTNHEIMIPADEGTIHVRISSSDEMGRESQSEDITVMVPEPAPPIPAPTSTPDQDITGEEPDDIGILDDEDDQDFSKDKEPILQVNGVESPKQSSGGLTATNALLGGLALLLAGALIGVLIKTRKQQ